MIQGLLQHTFYRGSVFLSLTVSPYFGFRTFDYYQREGKILTDLALVSVALGLLAFVALFTGVILFTLIRMIRETQRD